MFGLTIQVVPKIDITQWLNNHYLDWQREFGVRPEKDFAEWLGVNSKTFNHWRNGRRKPSAEDCDILAYKLKDMACYEILGFPTPDPLLLRVKMEWETLSDEQQVAIGEILAEEEKGNEERGTPRGRGASARK